jgi:uncharacterized protein (TIGR04255 family)
MIAPTSGPETHGSMKTPQPARPADLPNFLRPPVTEVVLSIQFAALPTLQTAHVGLLWQKWRDKYPVVSEQPPLGAVFETFGGASAFSQPAFQFQALLVPSMPRFWFAAADDVDLVQVQQDRIVHNWRKRTPVQEYPRYEAIRSRFVEDMTIFRDFLSSENLGEVQPNQCEVTYTNAIELPDSDEPYGQLSKVTPLWTGRLSEAQDHDVENCTIQSRFVLREDGYPYGRVHVGFAPAVLPFENRSVIRLDITVRGKPKAATIESALGMLDNEREIVVRTFAAVTTPEMWTVWGRTDAK